MKTVFYCPSCDYVGAAEETEVHICPECGHALYRTKMDRETFVTLTDEQKNEVKAQWKKDAGDSYDSDPKTTAGGNRVAGALKVIAVLIYILSALAGVFLLNNDAVAAGWILLASGIVSGTLFLGFGEIIRLLDVISKK